MNGIPQLATTILLLGGLHVASAARAQDVEIEAATITDVAATIERAFGKNPKRELVVFVVPGLGGPKPLFTETSCASIDAEGEQGTGRSFKHKTEVKTSVELQAGQRISLGGLLESDVAKVNRRGINWRSAQIEIPASDLQPPDDVEFKEFGLRLEVTVEISKGTLRPGEGLTCLTLVAAAPEPPQQRARYLAKSAWRERIGPAKPPAGAVAEDGTLGRTTSWIAVTATSAVHLNKLSWLRTAIVLTDSHRGEDGGGPGYSSACTSFDADASPGTGKVLRYDYELSAEVDGARQSGRELLAQQAERIKRKGTDSRGKRLQSLSRSLGDFLALQPAGQDVQVTETYDFRGRLKIGQSFACGTTIVAPALLSPSP